MAVLYFLPQKKTTTLSTVGGITTNSQTTGIKISSVDGVDITKPGILCVNWANPINETLYEYITYTSIDGTNELQGVTRGAEGSTARDTHASGVTVAFIYSKSHINNLNDKLNGNDAVAIEDPHGNEVLKTAHEASAVNEVTITNSATGNAVQIAGTGGDTDISINLVPKGAGVVQIGGVAAVTVSSTATLTNKRITKRVVTTTDDATAVIDCAITDDYQLSAIANNTEFTVTGTPTDGQPLIIRFKDAGVLKNLTFTGFTAMGVTIPTATTAGKWGYVGAKYNLAATTWHVLAVGTEA